MVNETIFKAVETGDADEVEKALREEKINAASYFGVKSIVFAAKQENSKILKMLLKNGESVSRETFWQRAAAPALSNAIRADNTEAVKLLLEYGAGKDKKISKSPLLGYDTNRGSKEMEKLLSENGFGVVKNNGNTGGNTDKSKYISVDGIFLPEDYFSKRRKGKQTNKKLK